jgi:hypothetical protein
MTGQRSASFALFVVCGAFFEAPASAQGGGAAGGTGTEQAVGALKQSLAQNNAALKSYTWVETTEISLKGEVKKTEQKQCRYGPDGKVEKTPLPGAAPPQQPAASGGGRRGALKKAIVEKKVGEMKDYMERVAALVHEYVPPDPQKIGAAQAAGNIYVQPSQGALAIAVKDYLKPGDSLALGVDSGAKQLRSYTVHSYVDKPKDDAVSLAVVFASLPDGTNHPQETVLDAPGKKIQVKITNSGYAKGGQ